MHFAWDAEQQTFRTTVRDFLAAHLPKDWELLAHGPASEAQSAFSRKFCGQLADAGLLVPHWPKRWGGRDAGAWTSFILAEEMWEAGEPRGGQYMNVNWIGPTLMRFGSEEQQARYIPPMARGETHLVPGVLRAGGGIGPGLAADPRGEARLELSHQRPENLDFLRAACRDLLSAREDRSRARRHLRVPRADGYARHHRARDSESHR
jgi:alkylation response protein AidB-like acyl-CoA dehydrogenase